MRAEARAPGGPEVTGGAVSAFQGRPLFAKCRLYCIKCEFVAWFGVASDFSSPVAVYFVQAFQATDLSVFSRQA